MAGVKGRSGGPRANSGGSRSGSGRKPKPPANVDAKVPLEILLAFARDKTVSDALRIRAAGLAAQYVHHKMGEGGKKAAEKKSADGAVQGRFAPTVAPKLVVNNT